MPAYRVIGAGPAGLAAATTLARSGRQVELLEKAPKVGHRFAGDFQGLENWSSPTDALERLAHVGVEASFEHQPFREVTFYDRTLRPHVARSSRPLFYLVRRGPEGGSLDRSLLDQARDAGVDVRFNTPAERADRGDIVAVGPRHADGIVSGYVFPTSLPDQAHCIISERLAPAGYAYFLVWNGRATLATCLFASHARWRDARDAAAKAFGELVPGTDLTDARPFTGFGSVFGSPRYTDEAGRLYAGEAAGLQDPEWGFGMWLAIQSGVLAAQSLVDGFDYEDAAHELFDDQRKVKFANRLIYERLPERFVAGLLRREVHRSVDLGPRVRRHWEPSRLKSAAARVGLGRFVGERLAHRDRACHSGSCDCVWCTHGTHVAVEDHHACP